VVWGDQVSGHLFLGCVVEFMKAPQKREVSKITLSRGGGFECEEVVWGDKVSCFPLSCCV